MYLCCLRCLVYLKMLIIKIRILCSSVLLNSIQSKECYYGIPYTFCSCSSFFPFSIQLPPSCHAISLPSHSQFFPSNCVLKIHSPPWFLLQIYDLDLLLLSECEMPNTGSFISWLLMLWGSGAYWGQALSFQISANFKYSRLFPYIVKNILLLTIGFCKDCDDDPISNLVSEPILYFIISRFLASIDMFKEQRVFVSLFILFFYLYVIHFSGIYYITSPCFGYNFLFN